MPFHPIKRTRMAEQVAEAVRDSILGGSLEPGDALPAERDLAEQFGVNRSSVREALHRLEAWGLIETRQGSGTRVKDFLATAGLHLLPYLIAPNGQPDPALLRDLLELRVNVLGWTAQQAARRGSPEAAAGLEATLERLQAAETREQAQRLDYDFFEQMIALSGNRVLLLLSNVIRTVYQRNHELFAGLYGALPVDVSLHREAVAAIARGDAAAARAAMEAYGAGALGLS